MEPSTALGSPEGLGVLGAPGSQDTHGSESCRGQKGLISRKSLGGQRRGQWGREGGSGRDRGGGTQGHPLLGHGDAGDVSLGLARRCPAAVPVQRLGVMGGRERQAGGGQETGGGGVHGGDVCKSWVCTGSWCR